MFFQIRNQLIRIIPDDMVNVDKFTVCIIDRSPIGLQMQEYGSPADKGFEIAIKPIGFLLNELMD